jgi:hypothetical protein
MWRTVLSSVGAMLGGGVGPRGSTAAAQTAETASAALEVLRKSNSQWVHLVAAMLRGGFTPEEAGNIAGGNYMRVFRAAVG